VRLYMAQHGGTIAGRKMERVVEFAGRVWGGATIAPS
jgi:hypothetical protein